MPELPEVQTIISDLNNKILGKKIVKVQIELDKIVKNENKYFEETLFGNHFEEFFRRGKYIFARLSDVNVYLAIHLRMTGQIIYRKGNDVMVGGHGDQVLEFPNKHTHLTIKFEDGSMLFYNDMRQFGYWQLIGKEEFEKVENKLGLEPTGNEFKLQDFKKLILQHPKMNVKTFLLDQSKVTGIGNIYADEILFEAKVMPLRKTGELKNDEVKLMFQAIKKILRKAIELRGTTFNNYLDAEGRKGGFLKELKVYQRGGEKCKRCKTGVIEKIKIAGRGTRFCKRCQK